MNNNPYILLVDDDPDDLHLLREAIEDIADTFKISECKDGRSALIYLKEIANNSLPTNNFEGTGIGLAICKKIADKHNGYIYASSELYKGSEFTLALPLEN
jgi:nitrogen fixation/metabolism regulation signal transduction histidine kinase